MEARNQNDIQLTVGDTLPVEAKVYLNGLAKEDVAVEIVTGMQNSQGQLIDPQVTPMASM